MAFHADMVAWFPTGPALARCTLCRSHVEMLGNVALSKWCRWVPLGCVARRESRPSGAAREGEIHGR